MIYHSVFMTTAWTNGTVPSRKGKCVENLAIKDFIGHNTLVKLITILLTEYSTFSYNRVSFWNIVVLRIGILIDYLQRSLIIELDEVKANLMST